jgi:hypothetical protein
MSNPIDEILNEFREARKQGRQKYGGSDPVGHDLNHRLSDWLRFVRDHLDRAGGPDAFVALDQREHLVKAGGLLLSAIWALDVNAGRIPLPGADTHE